MRGSPARHKVHKSTSARKFRHQSGRSAAANVKPAPMRGGWRL